jgi:hypothetical protein
MTFILSTYLLYNVVAGFFLSIYCYYQDDYQYYNKDLLLVLLFPAVGLGYWQYNKDLRENGKTELPREWYMWKKMVRINWGYIIVVGLWAFSSVMGCRQMMGGGTEWANHQNDGLSAGLGLMYDIGSGLAFIGFALIMILGMGLMTAVLIWIPNSRAKSVEAQYYKEQLLKAKAPQGQSPSHPDNKSI